MIGPASSLSAMASGDGGRDRSFHTGKGRKPFGGLREEPACTFYKLSQKLKLKSPFTGKQDGLKGGRRPPGGGWNRAQANRARPPSPRLRRPRAAIAARHSFSDGGRSRSTSFQLHAFGSGLRTCREAGDFRPSVSLIACMEAPTAGRSRLRYATSGSARNLSLNSKNTVCALSQRGSARISTMVFPVWLQTRKLVAPVFRSAS